MLSGSLIIQASLKNFVKAFESIANKGLLKYINKTCLKCFRVRNT